jgi:Ribonuclease G/E
VSHTEVCPKCNGQGHVNTPPWIPGDQPTYMSSDTRSHPCPVCGGCGLIRYQTESLLMLRGRGSK